MTPEERTAHLIFAVSGVAGALEFHKIMPDKYKKNWQASALTYFYGACVGYSCGIFASGVTQIPVRAVGLMSALAIARRFYISNTEAKTRG